MAGDPPTLFELRPGWTADVVACLVGTVPNAKLKQLIATLSYEEYLNDDALSAFGLARPTLSPLPQASDDYPVVPVLLGTEYYPAPIAALPSAPAVLFVRGNLDALRLGVAVVGTREASAIAAATVPPAVAGAQVLGVPVISGLARGVDALAHEEALKQGLLTVAVLSTYPYYVTPAQNQGLSSRILDAGGAVMSESRATAPSPGLLHARNRLIAGLSSVLVPAEASLGSGTMTAVAAALEAERAVVVPVPRSSARDLPGAQALLALTGRIPLARTDLKVTNKTWERLSAQDYVANAAAETRQELTDLVVLAHRFSIYFDPAGD
jgi:DNA protecting protein DprA